MTKDVASSLETQSMGKGVRTLASTANVYVCYEAAVQNARQEIENIYNFYMEVRPLATSGNYEDFDLRIPLVLREDFCGTAVLCKEWLKKNVMRSAIGIDLDHNVLQYAKASTFDGEPPQTMRFLESDVMDVVPGEDVPRADILVALNYSLGYFHTFRKLVGYMRRAREGLAPGGVLVCDMLSNGTSETNKQRHSFVRDCGSFIYHFDQTAVDPLDNTCHCHLSFEFPDGSWLRNAFSYNFRIWSMAEIRDALLEAGFSAVEAWVSPTTSEGPKRKLIKLCPLGKARRCTLFEQSLNFYVVAI